MGDAKSKITRVLRLQQQYRSCAFCPGPIESAEHFGAKILFPGRHRPVGLELPSCKSCNNGTGQSDQLMAFMIYSQILDPSNEEREHMDKLVGAIGNNHRDIVREITSQKQWGRSPVIAGQRLPVVSMPASLAPHIEIVCDKLTMGAYFHASGGHRLPEDALINHYYLTNLEILTNGYPIETMRQLPKFDTLRQGAWTSFDEFRFRNIFVSDADVMLAEFQFMRRMAVISSVFFGADAPQRVAELGLQAHTSALPLTKHPASRTS